MIWRKPSYCNGATACPEINRLCDGRVQIRTTERPDVVVTFDRDEWRDFIDAAKAGEFDVGV